MSILSRKESGRGIQKANVLNSKCVLKNDLRLRLREWEWKNVIFFFIFTWILLCDLSGWKTSTNWKHQKRERDPIPFCSTDFRADCNKDRTGSSVSSRWDVFLPRMDIKLKEVFSPVMALLLKYASALMLSVCSRFLCMGRLFRRGWWAQGFLPC